jgi:16S rRNA (guanine527-N7)-methyltransferase
MNDHAGGGLPAAGSPRGSADRRRAPLPTRVEDLPELPAEYGRAVDAGLAALGLVLAAGARPAIDAHARLLLAWNGAINLTSISEPALVAMLHVVDSLTATALISARRPRRGATLDLLDIGSGGGYPGLVLTAALPDIRALLVDSVAKKARFLEAAVGAAGLADRAAVRAERVEALAPRVRSGELVPFDVVTARAIGSLAEMVELAFPVLALSGILVAWKRGDIGPEIVAATRAVAALGGGSVTTHDVVVPGLERHRLVVVEKAGSTPATFPREPGRRRARPW